MVDIKRKISKRGTFTKITNPNNGKVLVYKGYFARYSEELIIQCKSEGIKVFSNKKKLFIGEYLYTLETH